MPRKIALRLYIIGVIPFRPVVSNQPSEEGAEFLSFFSFLFRSAMQSCSPPCAKRVPNPRRSPFLSPRFPSLLLMTSRGGLSSQSIVASRCKGLTHVTAFGVWGGGGGGGVLRVVAGRPLGGLGGADVSVACVEEVHPHDYSHFFFCYCGHSANSRVHLRPTGPAALLIHLS